jgi:hypothetical protein
VATVEVGGRERRRSRLVQEDGAGVAESGWAAKDAGIATRVGGRWLGAPACGRTGADVVRDMAP